MSISRRLECPIGVVADPFVPETSNGSRHRTAWERLADGDPAIIKWLRDEVRRHSIDVVRKRELATAIREAMVSRGFTS